MANSLTAKSKTSFRSQPVVGLFRIRYPLPSEAFISEQVRTLQRYTPAFLIRTKVGHVPVASTAVSDWDWGRWRQLAFALRPRVVQFPNVRLLRSLDLLHAHFGPDGTYGMALAEELGVPLIVTFHGFDVTVRRSSFLHAMNIALLRYVVLETAMRDKAALFVAVSEFLRERLVERGYPSEKIVVHYIGVDTERFNPPKEVKSSERIVLNVARHTEVKGIPTLMRAFARVADEYPEVVLVQVGNGPLTRQLKSLVRDLRIANRVRFLGALPHETIRSLCQQAEVFALTSETAQTGAAEALGIVLNEASASGCPIVATAHGGIPEAVKHGETGLLSKEGDDVSVAENLRVLLSDRGLGRLMGRRGREFVCDVFDIRKQAAKLEALYDIALGAGRGRKVPG